MDVTDDLQKRIDEINKLLTVEPALMFLQPAGFKEMLGQVYEKMGKNDLAAIAEAIALLAVTYYSATHSGGRR